MTESPDVIIGEVLPDEKVDGKKKAACAQEKVTMWRLALSSRKSNDLIQRTKYSLPRNETEKSFL